MKAEVKASNFERELIREVIFLDKLNYSAINYFIVYVSKICILFTLRFSL